MKREANFNSYFNKWVKNVYRKTAAFELKQTQTDSLPFSALQEHQAQALLQARWETFVFKIPDAGYQNPFDCFSLSGVPAYVVVFYADGKFFCLIDIETFMLEDKRSKRRSLTASRAKDIATLVIPM